MTHDWCILMGSVEPCHINTLRTSVKHSGINHSGLCNVTRGNVSNVTNEMPRNTLEIL